MSYCDESKDLKVTPVQDPSEDIGIANSSELKMSDESHEVFKRGDGQVDFRTVSWIRASAIFLKSKPQPTPQMYNPLTILF